MNQREMIPIEIPFGGKEKEDKSILKKRKKKSPKRQKSVLIDFLHPGSVFVVVALQRRHVVDVEVIDLRHIGGVGVLVETQAQLHHTVDATGVDLRVFEAEPGGEEGGFVEQHDQILDRFVVLVRICLLTESLHDRVLGVDLKLFLGRHISERGSVSECLGLHDPLHIGSPSVLGGNDAAGRRNETARNDNLLHSLVGDVLDDLAESLEKRLQLFASLLLVLVLRQLQALFRHGHQRLAVVLFELLNDVFIDGLGHVKDFESSLLDSLNESRVGHRLATLAGDVINLLLVFLHAADIVLQGSLLFARRGRVVSEQLGQLLPVGRVFVNSEFDVFGELLEEFGAEVLILDDVVEHLQTLLDEVLTDHLQDLVLLEHLSGDVEGEILRVDDAADEAEVFGDQFVTIVHDEDATDVQLDIVLRLFVLKKIEGSALGNVEKSLELELALDGEVLAGKMIFPVVGETLVEVAVFLLGDIVGVPRPDRFSLVQFLVLVELFLDLFGLLGLGFVLLRGFVLLLPALVVGYLLLLLLRRHQVDRVSDELGMLLDDFFDLFFVQIFCLVVLHVQNDSGAAGEVGDGIGIEGLDGEGATGGGFPLVVVVVVVFGLDGDAVRDQVGGVEADAELTDHRNVRAGRQGFHEGLSAGFCDGSEIVDEIGFGHADAGVPKRQSLVLRIRNNPDLELFAGVEFAGFCEGFISDFVQGVRGIGDQLSEENLFVGVESVDDEGHKLSDLSLEGKGFHFFCHLDWL